MKHLSLVFCLACLAGCAGLPEAEKASQLGDAITASGKLVRDAIAANRANAIRNGEEVQASNLLRSKEIRPSPSEVAMTGRASVQQVAGSPEAIRDAKAAFDKAKAQQVAAKQAGLTFTLADAPTSQINGLQNSAQMQAAKALEGYGDALKKAIDEGTIEKLEQASVKLGDAAGNIVTAASPLSAPIAGPALKVGSRIAGFLMGNAYANEIQAIIVARNKDVIAIAALLKEDMALVGDSVKRQADFFEVQRKANLQLIGQDPNVTRLQLYNEYYTARKEAGTMRATAVAAAKYAEVLDALVEAHAAVAAADPNSELFLKRFVVLADDLAALIKAAKKEA